MRLHSRPPSSCRLPTRSTYTLVTRCAPLRVIREAPVASRRLVVPGPAAPATSCATRLRKPVFTTGADFAVDAGFVMFAATDAALVRPDGCAPAGAGQPVLATVSSAAASSITSRL
jgi:hypothetical protein